MLDTTGAAGSVVLHVAPHPDDELIGAPATLMALRDRGLRIVNLAVGLGAVEQRTRRVAELRRACARAGFELVMCEPPLDICAEDDLRAAEQRVVLELGSLLAQLPVAVVVGPHPHEGHHAHELVGRAVRRALQSRGRDAPPWWAWSLWADLPLPTLVVGFDEQRLQEVLQALGAHVGELQRNAYQRLVAGRATANAVLGAERVFGFGAAALAHRYAELLCELVLREDEWYAGLPRLLDDRVLVSEHGGQALGWWLTQPSFHARLRRRSST